MTTHNLNSRPTFIFRQYRPWYIGRIGIFVGLTFGLALVALRFAQPVFAAAAMIAGVLFATFQFLAYRSNAVIIRGRTLYIRRGVFNAVEYPLPLWRNSPIYHRTLLDAFCDCTSVTIRRDDGFITVSGIAHAADLRELVDDIQSQLFDQVQRRAA